LSDHPTKSLDLPRKDYRQRTNAKAFKNEAPGFGVERMSSTGTDEDEKSRRTLLTVWTLSGMRHGLPLRTQV